MTAGLDTGTPTGSIQQPTPGRLVVVSHRLPVEIDAGCDPPELRRTVGGMAGGIEAFLDSPSGRSFTGDPLWVGWAGSGSTPQAQMAIERALEAHRHLVAVSIPPAIHARFYDDFSNRALWPLCHTFPSMVHLDQASWEAYRTANEAFCDALVPRLEPGDLVWVHDYHLMLLPRLLRQRVPDLHIAYFHHVPFPHLDVLRVLPDPWAKALLDGLLGADVVGFHTYDDVRHAVRAIERLLDRDVQAGAALEDGRTIQFDAFPIGVDFRRWAAMHEDPQVQSAGQAIDKTLGGRRMILSVDRLDYTKGILNRLLAFEHFLEKEPAWKGRVTLVAVVVPSRGGVDAYRQMRTRIEEVVGRVNGTHGDGDWTPVVYRYRALDPQTLAAHYLRADVALVTPLRDGMNLVAKELLAARCDESVALVLSDTAGAAREMGEALRVNPFHAEGISEALGRALSMPEAERRRRCRHLRMRLERYDVTRWGGEQVERLREARRRTDALRARHLPPREVERMVAAWAHAQRRLLLLDYDGTLVPFASVPEAAAPDEPLRRLLERLGSRPDTSVVVVSGRDGETLGAWLRDLPVALVAEHGSRLRDATGTWVSEPGLPDDVRRRVLEIMGVFADRLPGAFVEAKVLSVAWHWRGADLEVGSSRARELVEALGALRLGPAVKVFAGKRVVEVRNARAHKGTAAQRWLADVAPDFVLAAGDDTTDEDLFAILPPEAWSLKVGPGESRARWNMRDADELRSILERLARTEAR
jgi:trehalose 6-phosphate synthase/phosphatase